VDTTSDTVSLVDSFIRRSRLVNLDKIRLRSAERHQESIRMEQMLERQKAEGNLDRPVFRSESVVVIHFPHFEGFTSAF